MPLANNLIGVLSDTHDQVHYLAKIIDFLNEQEVELVVHCGDWVSPFTLIHYQKLRAPMYGIFGNNDGDPFRHLVYSKRWEIDIRLEAHFMAFNHGNKKIAIYHGEYPEIVQALAKSADYDLVLFGHDHRPRVERYGNTVALNPGSLMDYTNESTRGASFAIYDCQKHEGRILRIDQGKIFS